MGITRALQRVKRQARRGGLGALRTGLGEGLRSASIPRPLRGAAKRIAALLDPASMSRHSSHKPGSTATHAVERAHTENLRAVPPEHANKVGSDRGDAPSTEPEALDSGTAVDPVAVGATPVYDATPLEVEPVDASPTDVAAVDATPITLEATSVAVAAGAVEAVVEPAPEPVLAPAPAAAKPKAKAKPRHVEARPRAGEQRAAHGSAKKSAAPLAAEPKEKLAPAEEAAKSAARSGPKGAAKRPHGQGGKTSKKK
jgi:hypothetical protein